MKRQTKFKDTEIGKIPEDWEVVIIDTVLDKIIDYRGKTPKKSDSGIKTLSARSVKNGYIDYSQTYFISEETFKKWVIRGKPLIGDILLTTEGPLGVIARLDRDDVAIAQRLLTLRGKKEILDNSFLMYYLMSSTGQHQLSSRATGTTVQGIKQSEFRKVLIIIPKKINEQKAIAKILSDLDSKIEFNQQMNKTLEATGQAIFKHWFVDFEFPNEEGKPYKSSGGEMVFYEELGKEIPKGWEVKSLDKIADYLNGLALQKYPPKGEVYLPVIKIKELRQGITTQSDKANSNIDKNYIINNGDILFSWSGSLMVVIWGGGKGALNQHLFKVTSENFEKWFYYYWTKHHLEKFVGIAKDKATTMGHIKRKHLAESKVLVPNRGIMEKINKIMEPVIDKILNNKIGIIRFQKTRDSLLPKLMSGKIRVPVEVE